MGAADRLVTVPVAMAMAVITLAVAVAAYSPVVHAEYRAFELVITDPSSGQERVELSSLDPNQYRAYYPIKAEERITYRATWRCRGNTSHFQPICPKPEGR